VCAVNSQQNRPAAKQENRPRISDVIRKAEHHKYFYVMYTWPAESETIGAITLSFELELFTLHQPRFSKEGD